jgi:hypothetical protein
MPNSADGSQEKVEFAFTSPQAGQRILTKGQSSPAGRLPGLSARIDLKIDGGRIGGGNGEKNLPDGM